jgi:hypothetical protein
MDRLADSANEQAISVIATGICANIANLRSCCAPLAVYRRMAFTFR